MNFTRNLGFVTVDEQALLGTKTVAIAGVGGDGGLVAEGLARLGVTKFRLADPDPFEVENLNRQAGCTVANIGRNKAVVIAEIIKAINPAAQVEVYSEGVFPHNVGQFTLDVDLVVDETEFTLPYLAVMIARAARRQYIPVVTGFNVGFGCLVTSFQPDGMTLEEHLGLDVAASLDVIKVTPVGLDKWIPRLPDYVSDELVMQVATGQISAPSVFPGVALAAGCVVSEVFAQLVNRRPPLTAPQVLWIDALQHSFEIVETATV